jgi:hypothetical protein
LADGRLQPMPISKDDRKGLRPRWPCAQDPAGDTT